MWIPFHTCENYILFHLNSGFTQIFNNVRQSAVNLKWSVIIVVNLSFGKAAEKVMLIAVPFSIMKWCHFVGDTCDSLCVWDFDIWPQNSFSSYLRWHIFYVYFLCGHFMKGCENKIISSLLIDGFTLFVHCMFLE